jgi:hypothetical protein
MDAAACEAVIAVAMSKGVVELGVPKHDQACQVGAGVNQVTQRPWAHVPAFFCQANEPLGKELKSTGQPARSPHDLLYL